MVRHIGEKRVEDAKKVAIYSLFFSAITSAAFSVLSLILMTPLLYLLGARNLTLVYGKQYLLTTVVLGGIPTVLSMSMSQLLRNAGYAKEAGIALPATTLHDEPRAATRLSTDIDEASIPASLPKVLVR